MVFKAEKANDKRQQKIRIYYNCIGAVDIPKRDEKRHRRESDYANFFRLLNPYGKGQMFHLLFFNMYAIIM
nr:DUF4368 domain-containing protein [Proteiniborus ethanoligenes]